MGNIDIQFVDVEGDRKQIAGQEFSVFVALDNKELQANPLFPGANRQAVCNEFPIPGHLGSLVDGGHKARVDLEIFGTTRDGESVDISLSSRPICVPIQTQDLLEDIAGRTPYHREFFPRISKPGRYTIRATSVPLPEGVSDTDTKEKSVVVQEPGTGQGGDDRDRDGGFGDGGEDGRDRREGKDLAQTILENPVKSGIAMVAGTVVLRTAVESAVTGE
jgi:hypothetical protein